MAKNLYSFHSLINGVQKDGYRTLAKKPQTSNLPYVFLEIKKQKYLIVMR